MGQCNAGYARSWGSVDDQLRVGVYHVVDGVEPIDGHRSALQHEHIQPPQDLAFCQPVHDKTEDLPLLFRQA